MADAYLFEQYDPKKFESDLKKIKDMTAEDRQKLLLDTLLNPSASFLTPVLPDGKSFKLLRTKDGKAIFPIYTSQKKAMKDPTFDVSAKMFRGTIGHYGSLFEKNEQLFGIMLNYTPDQSGLFLSRESVLQMKEIYMKRLDILRQNANGMNLHQVQYQTPAKESLEAIAKAVTPVLESCESVTECWVRRASSKNKEEHTDNKLVYIVNAAGITEEEGKKLSEGLASASSSLLNEGETVEMIPASSKLGERLISNVKPLYQK